MSVEKMKKKDSQIGKEKNYQSKKKNNFLLIFICIFVSVIILFGAVFGMIAAFNQSEKLVRFGSLGLDEGELNYLASYHKYDFMVMLSDAGIRAEDSPAFWSSKSFTGASYGELLRKSFKDFVSGLLISIRLFEEQTELAAADTAKIQENINRTLQLHGGVENFNKKSEKYGFNFDDYRSCAEFIYKAAAAKGYFVGVNGSKLSASQCSEFFEQYSHVSLIFLYDETYYYVDDNGTLQDRPLTNAEKADREVIAQKLREAILAFETKEGDPIAPEMFEFYYKQSDSDQDMLESGYYFKRGAESTDAFEVGYPEVVAKALEMELGEYSEVKFKDGTCFIYKYKNNQKDIDPEKNPFFSDFYSDASDFVFSKQLEEYVPNVEFAEGFANVDILSVPYDWKSVIVN